MKKLHLLAVAVLAVPRLAWALPDMSGVEGNAKAAFADITKAKTALNAGKTKTSDSWLSKAETLLKGAMNKAPGGAALGKANEAVGANQQADAQKSNGGLAAAQEEATKLDPSLAAKLGQTKNQTAQGDTFGSQNTVPDAGDATAQKTGLSGLQNTYQKVTMARSLLKAGDSTKAKGILDQIPSSPSDMLKGLSGL